MDRLRLLGSCCDDLGRDISETEMYNDELYDYLQNPEWLHTETSICRKS